eukprot:938504-Pleurochrysis_carterae.AAC.1
MGVRWHRLPFCRHLRDGARPWDGRLATSTPVPAPRRTLRMARSKRRTTASCLSCSSHAFGTRLITHTRHVC